MIETSYFIKATALVAAMGLHVAIFYRAPEPTLIAAAGAPTEAKMGSSFADLAVGVQQPTQAAPAPQAPVTPVVPTVVPATAVGVSPVVAAQPEPPQTPTPIAEPVVPVAPQTVAPVAPTETIEALDNAPTTSIRPQTRPQNIAATTTPVQERGNANQQANAGANDRQTASSQARSGSNASQGAVAPASNAAQDNYRGQVVRRIHRAKNRVRLRGSGSATITFRIAASGAATSIRVSRSSGDAELDQKALEVIQRASPFPTPPAGMDTGFHIVIESE